MGRKPQNRNCTREVNIFLALLISLALPAAVSCQTAHETESGPFDYYLLTLSWSPDFCFHEKANPECSDGKRHGFVVHGLWPEFRNGTHPSNCSSAPGLSDPAKMLDIMPDPQLIAHEWEVHGTCSGLTADAYFDLIRKAYASIAIPDQFKAPQTQVTITPDSMKQNFEAKNPNLTDADLVIECGGKYLTAVQVCMSKTLNAIPCPNPQDCHARTIVIAPVR